MIFSRLKFLHLLSNHLRCYAASVAAVPRPDTALWTPAPLVEVFSAAESLFHIAIDVSGSPELAASYTTPGQYLQARPKNPCIRPTFLAIASPPSSAVTRGVFEFLVKSIPGSTAELLCRLEKGDAVRLSAVMGKGFEVDRISPPENYQTVLIFATGAGIRRDLNSGSLPGSILCQFSHSLMIVGKEKEVLFSLHLLEQNES